MKWERCICGYAHMAYVHDGNQMMQQFTDAAADNDDGGTTIINDDATIHRCRRQRWWWRRWNNNHCDNRQFTTTVMMTTKRKWGQSASVSPSPYTPLYDDLNIVQQSNSNRRTTMAMMTTHITPHRRCMLMRACAFVIIVFAIRCNIEYLCQSSNHDDEKQYTFSTTTALLWNAIYIIIKIHNYPPPLIVPFSSWYLQLLSSLFPLYADELWLWLCQEQRWGFYLIWLFVNSGIIASPSPHLLSAEIEDAAAFLSSRSFADGSATSPSTSIPLNCIT